MKSKLLFLGILINFWVADISAQQLAGFSQYMFNGLAINPAYAGVHEAVSVTATSRWQWAGFEGAPNTQNLAVHAPIKDKNIGLGVQFMRDEIGFNRESAFQLNYAYRINMPKGTLSLGLLAGLSNFSIQYADARVITADPTQVNLNEVVPNFGAGAFYYRANAYLGISAPVLIKSTIETEQGSLFEQQSHFFITGGTVFSVSRNVKLKPNFLLKMVSGSPVGYNINLNAIFNDIFWFGVSVRPPESINFLLEFQATDQLRIGYGMDYILDEVLSQAATTSHEFMINYRFNWGNKTVITPRYF